MDLNAKLISKMELLLPKLVEEGLATTAEVNTKKGGRKGWGKTDLQVQGLLASPI